MSSNPFDPNPSPDNRLGKLDETSGFAALPQADQTNAFDTKTKLSKKGERSKIKKNPPQTVGGYELGEMLGQGGMGRVFRADDSTGRSVALKLLDSSKRG
jgi:hypothetical protein